uniref:Kinesin motor domain-containing protein n=1 Tax=Physcomitrium patens TaxID=3218 RepID=A0A2K1J2A5_PHYPA|nr:hypothetical protein PHYPA_021506 [Physcomitrium patens]
MASISTVPIDKLLLDPSSVLRKPVNVISPKRRKCPRERFVQSMENLAIPLGQSEKRLRLYGAGGDGAMDSENATSSAERVRVTVRVRPPTRVEQREEDGPPFIFLDTEKNTVILRRRGSFMDFTEFQFDAVLPPTALQVDVYNMAARAVVLAKPTPSPTTSQTAEESPLSEALSLAQLRRSLTEPAWTKTTSSMSLCPTSRFTWNRFHIFHPILG